MSFHNFADARLGRTSGDLIDSMEKPNIPCRTSGCSWVSRRISVLTNCWISSMHPTAISGSFRGCCSACMMPRTCWSSLCACTTKSEGRLCLWDESQQHAVSRTNGNLGVCRLVLVMTSTAADGGSTNGPGIDSLKPVRNTLQADSMISSLAGKICVR